jgi:hypothetical protein
VKEHNAFNGPHSRRARLEEEIQYMEVRLNEIGFEGDCAYERAMSKFYRAQIATRREQLDLLEA